MNCDLTVENRSPIYEYKFKSFKLYGYLRQICDVAKNVSGHSKSNAYLWFTVIRQRFTIKQNIRFFLNNNIDRTESILNQWILFEFIFPAGFCVPQRQQATCYVCVPFRRDCTVRILSVISCLIFVSMIKMRRWENPDATKYVSTQRTMDAECFFLFFSFHFINGAKCTMQTNLSSLFIIIYQSECAKNVRLEFRWPFFSSSLFLRFFFSVSVGIRLLRCDPKTEFFPLRLSISNYNLNFASTAIQSHRRLIHFLSSARSCALQRVATKGMPPQKMT